VVPFLVEHGKLTEDQRKIAECNLRFARQVPVPLDVPVRIVYNSGFETSFGLKLDRIDGEGKVTYRPGDGIVNSEGIEHVCRYWRSEGADIECRDLNSTRMKTHHAMLVLARSSFKVALDWVAPEGQTRPDQEL